MEILKEIIFSIVFFTRFFISFFFLCFLFCFPSNFSYCFLLSLLLSFCTSVPSSSFLSLPPPTLSSPFSQSFIFCPFHPCLYTILLLTFKWMQLFYLFPGWLSPNICHRHHHPLLFLWLGKKSTLIKKELVSFRKLFN